MDELSVTSKTVSRRLCLVLLWPLLLSSQALDYESNGYIKYLPTYTHFSTRLPPIPGLAQTYTGTYFDHLLHARSNNHFYFGSSWRAAAEIRLRALQGNSLQNIPGYKDLYFASAYEFNPLEIYLWESDASVGHAQVDRLWLDFNYGDGQITIGRQRVAWGTSLVWNITDLFNPMDILDFDYEERPGTDALRGQYYLGPLQRLDFVIKPGATREGVVYAAAYSFNFASYDYTILLGQRQQLWQVGASWAGDIRGAGFRGEFLLTEKLSAATAPYPPLLLLPDTVYRSLYKSQATNAALVLSADYTFSNSFYLHSELMYNSTGITENTALYRSEALSAGRLSAARFAIFQEAAYDVTPLARASAFAIFNPDDSSWLLAPGFTYSLVTNLDMLLIAYFTGGTTLSEYGSFGEAAFLRLKYSF
jgi:hypothetical protein